MPNRSARIHGRISRKLRISGFPLDEIDSADIYDEMQMAQDAVFQEVKVLERSFNVMLQNGIENYPLRTTFAYNTNLHTAANAANSDPDVEANATTGWSASGGSLSSVASPRTDSPGSYSIKHTLATEGDLIKLTSLSPGSNRYQYVEFWVRAIEDCTLTLYMAENDAEKCTPLTFEVTDDWAKVYGYIDLEGEGDSFQMYTDLDTAGDWIEFDDFNLYTQTVSAAARKVIGKIKQIIQPEAWSAELRLVSNEEYNNFKREYIQSTNTQVARSSIGTGTATSAAQPEVCTVFEDELWLYPLPTDANENDELTLWCFLMGSESVVSSTIEPETPDGFDKAIEHYAFEEYVGRSGLTPTWRELVRMNKQKVTNKGHILQKQRRLV